MKNTWLKENHIKTGNNYVSWEIASDNLDLAANILKTSRENIELGELYTGDPVPPEIGLVQTELFLRGSSLECIMKALYLKLLRGDLVDSDGYKKIPSVGEHDLVQLAKAVGIESNEKELFLLSRLTLYAKMGRYPIPKKWQDDFMRNWPEGGGLVFGWFLIEDHELYQRFRNNIKKLLSK